MVEEVLVPDGRVGGGEAAQAAVEEVHVEVGDLRPGVEGWGETEGWRQERKKGGQYDKSNSGGEVKESEWDMSLTFIPPSCAHAQVLLVFRLWYFDTFLTHLRNGVVCLSGTFLDQGITDTVRYICFC